MIILDCQQGTTEWIRERLWRLTASEAKTNISEATGSLSNSKAAIAAIDKLIAGIELAKEMKRREAEIENLDEWDLKKFMSHYVGDVFKGNHHTERGHDLENEALAKLSERTGIQFEDVGMCVIGDGSCPGYVSCSPDGIGRNSQGVIVTGAELKNSNLAKFNGMVADDEMHPDYKLQVHFSMAVCELESWHFGAHFRGKGIFHKVIHRDKYTDAVEKSIQGFIQMYADRLVQTQEGYKRLLATAPKAPLQKPAPTIESII